MNEMARCLSLVEELTRSQSAEDMHRCCSRLCTEYGFDHFFYGSRFPVSFIKPYLFLVSGFPDEWWERYKRNSYFQQDPVFALATKQTSPIDWKRLIDDPLTAKRDLGFMEEAAGFNLRSGITSPLYGPNGEIALFSLVSSLPCNKTVELVKKVHLILPFLTSTIHEAARRIISRNDIHFDGIELTGREKECLLWVAEGKTSWEISQILSISERTVVFHLQNTTTKLKVNNRQQAVIRAVFLGLISPQFS